jgi:uncharacterized membrane protein YfcA
MVDWTTIAIVLPTLVVAYIIFGIAGFGTALVAAPVLAHALPIASVVPLSARPPSTASSSATRSRRPSSSGWRR